MTVQQILAEARRRLDDTTAPYLWSDAELVGHLDKKINFACEKGRLIIDSSTAAICRIALHAADVVPDYPLSDRIIEILSAKIFGQPFPLTKRLKSWMDLYYPLWRSNTAGTPLYYILDYTEGYITLDRKVSADANLDMTVLRLPVNPVTTETPNAVPEINSRFHIYLVDGIMAEAYLKEDTQTLDPQKAQTHEGRFLAGVDLMEKAAIRKRDTEQSVVFHRGAF